jgi:hypothetical protein
MNPISRTHFILFKLLFGVLMSLMFMQIAIDRVIYDIFGPFFYAFIVLGVFFSLLWTSSKYRKFLSVCILICLAIITELSPWNLNVISGYMGWILIANLFIPEGEGHLFSTRTSSNSKWIFPVEIQYAIIVVLGFSFLFSGVTKLLSPFWLSGEALAILSENVRFNRSLGLSEFMHSQFGTAITYLTIVIEILFLPLYLYHKTRRLSWWLIFILFLGIVLLMRIYTVSLGLLIILTLLYPSCDQKK